MRNEFRGREAERQWRSKVSGGGSLCRASMVGPFDFKQKIGLWHDCDTARYKQAIQILRFTSNYFKKFDSVNCKHIDRGVTRTSVKTTSAVCMARRLVTKSTI